MGTVIDRTRWPVVTVCVEHAGDLDELADGLDEILAAEESFAISVVAPRDIEAFQEMLRHELLMFPGDAQQRTSKSFDVLAGVRLWY